MTMTLDPNRTPDSPYTENGGDAMSTSQHVGSQFDGRWVDKQTVWTQIIGFAILIMTTVLCALISVPAALPAVVTLLMLGVYIVCWPFVAQRVERVIAALSGLASILVSMLPIDIEAPVGPSAHAAAGEYWSVVYILSRRWAVTVFVILIVALVASFVRQMLRERRINLVRSLSRGLLSALVAVGIGGWMMVDRLCGLMRTLDDAPAQGLQQSVPVWVWLSVGIIACSAMVWLATASYHWWGHAATVDVNGAVASSTAEASDHESVNPTMSAYRWIGQGLVPVMLSGFVVFLVVFLSALVL
jgi:hypothetical protein